MKTTIEDVRQCLEDHFGVAVSNCTGKGVSMSFDLEKMPAVLVTQCDMHINDKLHTLRVGTIFNGITGVSVQVFIYTYYDHRLVLAEDAVTD